MFGDKDPELGEYAGVDIDPSHHRAVVSGAGGFLLLNLEDHTTQLYPLEGLQGLKAVAVDRFRNTFVAAYWKLGLPLLFERGVLEVQLPNPAPEITSLTPSESRSRRGDSNHCLRR